MAVNNARSIYSIRLYNSYISEFPLYCNVSYVFSELIARVAVPLFFCVSGYLFFKKNSRGYSIEDYKSKIRTRVYSLVIPYFFWNILVFILTFLLQISISKGGDDTILNYSVTDFFRIFWDIRNGMPFCYQLWFIRDLIVITFISPIIYFLLKINTISLFVLILFAVWWLVDIDNVRWYLNSQSVFFFCLGAYCAIHQIDIVAKVQRMKSMSYLVSLASVAFIMFSFNDGQFYEYNIVLRQCIYHFCVLSLLFAFTNICIDNIKNKRWSVNKFLLNSTFFIYAYHAIVLGYCYHFLNLFFHNKSDVYYLAMYFLLPTIVIIAGLLIFKCLQKRLPNFAAIITGGRI